MLFRNTFFIAVCVLLGVCAPAHAVICSTSLPYTFVNGTTIDATQVNADLQAIISCVNSNAAHNGSNSDITNLTAIAGNSGAGPGLIASGTVAFFDLGAQTCPGGWVLANGSGGTTDARGRYLRAEDYPYTGTNPDGDFVGNQLEAVQNITATVSGSTTVTNYVNGTISGHTYATANNLDLSVVTNSFALSGGTISCTNCGNETRPVTLSLTVCQKQ